MVVPVDPAGEPAAWIAANRLCIRVPESIARPAYSAKPRRYASASMLAGALHVLGWAVAGALIREVIAVPLALVGVVAALTVVHELDVLRLPYPQRHWQVPARWVVGRGTSPAAVWGLTLGVGALTFIPYPSFFVGIAVAAWAASPVTGLVLGAAYGLGRAAPALASMWGGHGVADHHRSYLQSGWLWHRILALAAGVVVCLVLLPSVP